RRITQGSLSIEELDIGDTAITVARVGLNRNTCRGDEGGSIDWTGNGDRGRRVGGGRDLAAAGAHVDGGGVNKPADTVAAGIGAATPAQLNGLPLRGRRQIDDGGNEATGIAAPGLATRQRILEVSTEGMIVSATDKTAASGQDVGECAATDFDFQDAAIKPQD